MRRLVRSAALAAIEFGHRVSGRPWRKFYAWMLDRTDRNTSMQVVLASPKAHSGTGQSLYDVKRGEYHLEFLKRHGLHPEHRVLDFGCGYGRTAIPLLRYLERGNYTGVELSAERIRLAREFVALERLKDRQPRFIVSDDTMLSYLEDDTVDVFWAQSVFTHMPEEDVAAVLGSLRRVLAGDGMAIIDYDTTDSDKVEKRNIKGYFYPEAVFEGLVRSAGLEFAVLEDWESDLLPELRHASIRSLKLKPAVRHG